MGRLDIHGASDLSLAILYMDSFVAAMLPHHRDVHFGVSIAVQFAQMSNRFCNPITISLLAMLIITLGP